jgi:hypothetical protein
MLRYRSYTIALVVMLGGLSPAQAEDTVLTLACQGTATNHDYGGATGEGEPEPYSMRIVIDFTAQTVEGFRPIRAKIRTVTNAIVAFEGSEDGNLITHTISGLINLVIGDVQATLAFRDKDTGTVRAGIIYALKCRPTQRMF